MESSSMDEIGETSSCTSFILYEEPIVNQLVRTWQELNPKTEESGDELFFRCLLSESIVWRALTDLDLEEQADFKRRLEDLGYEVHDLEHHHQQACFFGERCEEYLRFDLNPTERRQAYEGIEFPDQITNSNTETTDEHLDPRIASYRHIRQRKITQLIRLFNQSIPQLSQFFREAGESQDSAGVLLLEQLVTSLGLHDSIANYQAQEPAVPEPRESRVALPEVIPRHWDSNYINELERKIIEAEEELQELGVPLDDPLFARPSPPSSPPPVVAEPPSPQPSVLRKLTLKMGVLTEVLLPLPVLPQGWSAEKDFKAIGTVSRATERSIEPVGPHFLAHARRARHKRTFSEDDRIQAQESVKKIEDDDLGDISEPEDPAMLMRDAKDWKGQDHYAVLGLSKYRWKATEEQIKRAHRKKVLRHHPDKKAAAGNTEDDSFFKCIQKATEILLDPVKRRQFDSVDDAADVEPPTKKQAQKGNFYKLWGPVFKAEGRFSRIQPVPKLGDEKSTKEEVENFYNFWYNFDSWRSFEYQDEDVPDDNENRDQKRHMERKNNNARKKKKTEDSARLRKLLDDCSAMDERIKKFRQEANASKNKKRLEKEAAEKKAAEEAKAKKEAEDKAAKEAEEAAKVEREQGKKAKEAAKNAVKKNKRVLKGSVKDANYFVSGEAQATIIDAVLNEVEIVQGKVDPDEIAALAAKLTGLKVADEIKAVWSDEVKRLIEGGKLKEGEVKTLVV